MRFFLPSGVSGRQKYIAEKINKKTKKVLDKREVYVYNEPRR